MFFGKLLGRISNKRCVEIRTDAKEATVGEAKLMAEELLYWRARAMLITNGQILALKCDYCGHEQDVRLDPNTRPIFNGVPCDRCGLFMPAKDYEGP